MTPKPAALPPMPASIWTLGFVSLLMDVSTEMIHSLLPVFLVTTLGASALTLGLLEGVAEATALFVKVFSGALSDYLGKRKLLAVLGYGLGACTKPLFAVAATLDVVVTARIIDRIGKGIRGAPRDALVAELAPPQIRGAAFGLRQSLDTVGAFIGPMLAMALMLLWNDVHAVFRVAIVPAFLSLALIAFGVREPAASAPQTARSPIIWANLKRLSSAYWSAVALGAIFTLARFSEAFLLLRAQQGGLPIAYIPLVLVTMNAVYSLAAYPFGKLSDRMSKPALLALGLVVLFLADLILAQSNQWPMVLAGVLLWGLHMGMTQGLLAAMVAASAPEGLTGTAFGFFNLVSGVAMLAASAVAGLLWDRLGAASTFYAGAGFCVVSLLAMGLRRPVRSDL